MARKRIPSSIQLQDAVPVSESATENATLMF